MRVGESGRGREIAYNEAKLKQFNLCDSWARSSAVAERPRDASCHWVTQDHWQSKEWDVPTHADVCKSIMKPRGHSQR